MEGDGFKVVRHCPNYEDHWDKEPDAGPFHCPEEKQDEEDPSRPEA